MSYLGRKSLMGLARCSLCYDRIARSHVHSRLTRHLSPQAPYKLRITLSDPATMGGCETLDLSELQCSSGQVHVEVSAPLRGKMACEQIYTMLGIYRYQKTSTPGAVSLESNPIFSIESRNCYSRDIELDDLDFLYQLHFDLQKCRLDSPISLDNLCGERVRPLRLWKAWFSVSEDEKKVHDDSSPMKLFTKIVWADVGHDVGFTVSAYKPPESYSSGMDSLVRTAAFAPKTYRIEIENIMIRNSYLLGIFEGNHVWQWHLGESSVVL